MTMVDEGTGWIVWSDVSRPGEPEPVGAGKTRTEAVDHARSRGIDNGVAKPHNAREARMVRTVLDSGAKALLEDDARWALQNMLVLAVRGNRNAAEWLRTRTASREEIEHRAGWWH